MKATSLYNNGDIFSAAKRAVVLSPLLYQKILRKIEIFHQESHLDAIKYILLTSSPLCGIEEGNSPPQVELEFRLIKFFDGSKVVNQWLCDTPIMILPHDKAPLYQDWS